MAETIVLRNLIVEQTDDEIVIRIKTTKEIIVSSPTSSTGKTLLVATTKGSLRLYSPHTESMWLSLNLMCSKVPPA